MSTDRTERNDHAGHHDDPFEDRLGAALRQTGDTFDTDRPALIAAGRARGRGLRLRRRAAVAGGAAGIALVGVAGALTLPGTGDGTGAGEQRSVGAGPVTPPPATSLAPRTATASVSAEEMISTLRELLPEGEIRDAQAEGGGALGTPSVRLVHDDGGGGGAVGVGLYRVEPGSQAARDAVTCPDKAYVPHDSCRRDRLSDGSVLMLFQGYEYPDRRVDTKLWRAELVTPEGQQVSVSEWNAEAEKDAPITRPQPPLSLAQLKAVATSSRWLPLVPAAPEGPGQPGGDAGPADPPATLTGSAADTLVTLLPEGAKVVDKGGEGGDFGYVVVDDGKGRSLVQINVQPGMGDVVGDLFGGAEILPDGTLVTERQGPGEKGGEGVVMWTADTLREDGLRVVISAFNSGAQHTPATRETPALTARQLREIALDPTWPALLR
ncbi:hypothetical protein ACIP2X_15630 [Streptomyces sp. NPDC089424]|uniref:hypothetical protein n=1 Tax=Streptomyces sp. NPDC089424 TaxID=3365917 RepID=UPI003807CF9D